MIGTKRKNDPILPSQQAVIDSHSKTIMGFVLNENEALVDQVNASLGNKMNEADKALQHLHLIRGEKKVLTEQRAIKSAISKEKSYPGFFDWLYHTLEDIGDNITIHKRTKHSMKQGAL